MFYEEKVALSIWKVFPPVLLVFGTIGNVMTILILMQRRNRNSSIAKYSYLTALAVSDLTVLWTALPRNFALFGYGFDIRSVSPFICKIHFYLLHLSTDCSTCCIVLLTVERFISAWMSTKVKRVCTNRNVSIVIFSFLICLIILNSHFLYGMDLSKESLCYPINDNYSNFFYNILPVLHVSLFVCIPVVILLVINISIIVRVLTMRRKIDPTPEVSTAARTRKAKDRQTTATLILVNVVFMVCVIPFTVFLFHQIDWILSYGKHDHSDAVLELIWAILNVLYYTNNAVNFLLYFISGSRFRKQVKEIFSKSLNFTCLARHKVNVRPLDERIENRHAAVMQNAGLFQVRTTRL